MATETETDEARIARRDAARAVIKGRLRPTVAETTVGSLLPPPERSKPVAKISRVVVSKKDSPTRSGRRLTPAELVKMSKQEVAAVAHQRGYARLHTGSENLRARFLAAQDADTNLEAAPVVEETK